MRVGVLALQGAFIEHRQRLHSLGVESFEIRQRKHLDQPIDALILPGGESTTMGRLLKDLDLFTPIQNLIRQGLPTLGTCAGMILMAEKITDESYHYFQTLPIEVTRNFYGRQLGSFFQETRLDGNLIDMVFIRAPIVKQAYQGVNVLLKVDGNIVAVNYHNQIGLSFHPELGKTPFFHQRLIDLAKAR